MEKLCPLIKFQDIRKPSFWVYNNLSTVLNSYKEKFGNYLSTKYFLGEVEKGFSCFCYLDVNEYSNYIVEFSNNQKLKNRTPWKYNILNSLAIDVLISTYNTTNDKVQSAVLCGGENKSFYPDPKELNLAVKDRLREIEPDFSRFDLNDINLQLLKCENNVDAFFTFHFKEYQGEDPHEFVNHAIELTKEVWNGGQPKNTDRKKYFDKWIESKINDGYLDRSKLKLETITTPEPPKQENLPVKNTTYYPASYTQIAPPTIQKPLWVYNNLVHIKGVANEYFKLKMYANDKTKEVALYVSGDDYRNRLNDFFEYINKNTFTDFSYELPIEEVPYNWKLDNYVFNILYFDLLEPFNEETEKYKFNSDGEKRKRIISNEGTSFYPDLTKYAKNYLKDVDSINLDNFLSFHFNSCYDSFKFLVHIIEITDDIWENSPNEIRCKKVLKKWVKEKIDFLEISNPQVLIDVYTSQKKIDYDEQFFVKDFLGNPYLDVFGVPVSNSVPFEVFYNAKLELKIYEFFQLNEKPTAEPPQARNNLEEIKNKIKVLCDPATFGHIILELYEKQYIELPQTHGDINFSKTAIQLLQLFDINTSKEYLAKCVNPNSNSLSEFTKRQIEIPLYDKKKLS